MWRRCAPQGRLPHFSPCALAGASKWGPVAVASYARYVPAIMFDDENEPLKKKPRLKKLDSLSIDELQDYISECKSEIARTEAEIARKKSSAAAADMFFKKG